MGLKAYPVIDLAATGDLRHEGLYVDALILSHLDEDHAGALGALLDVSLEQILIPVAGNPDIVCEQQAETCCSHCFLTGRFGCGKRPMQLPPFAPGARPAA